ncbi:ABC transporter permease subunit [Corynebacterium macginleyi]|uniref:Oligopeptide transport system permease protein OppC n=1 Tax=Corynebacterium macginleyi TaxID=38290 RepID=A0ABS1Y403_9CORY|nr:ABC transporter permease [Corynebacterium macginleyi]MBK4138609.1 ABC transporter permease subunit [Corynebacterium macginleyi]MBK4140672.1 ABC transporter permease subunit [Corynebacterium macginleyi]MBK4143574.1 ABC transporter permease subunit [Corynebacterium macginleyi]MBK4150477.1 ABC transporter permease subunit [Corynebacterium macginleyi]MBK4165855.1 ABC transporter permease subunit [Corynebacterium macginleyi]
MTNPKETKISKTQPRGEVSTRTEVISEDPLGTENAERVATLPEVPRGTARYKLYVRRFFRNKLATVGVVILGFLIFAAFFGNFFAQWDYTEPDFLALSEPPSPEHWFGTNDSGNDLYAQTIHGLGRSLTIAIVVSFATLVISAFIGCAAALWGGTAEKAVLAVIHFLLSIPTFLLIALVVADSGGDWKLLMVVLIAFGWMYQARVIWSLALTVREQDYVRAASYMGVSKMRIIVRHVIPNIGSLLIIQFVFGVVGTVGSETALSFLGLGVKLPDVSLGTLLQGGTASLQSAPWQFYFPAATLTLLTVSMAFIGDGLRDALDPNSKSGGKL